MSSFSTVLVTSNSTLLYGSQGSTSSPITVRNMDKTNSIYVGNVSALNIDGSNSTLLEAGDSVSFDGSVSIYAISPNGNVIVSLVPGGVAFSPGSVDISGPVTAEITGPVTVTGTVDIGNSPAVSISSGNVNATISGTPSVSVSGTTDVSVQNATIDVVGSGGFVLPGQLSLLFSNSSAFSSPAATLTQLGSWDVSTFNSVLITSVLPISNSTATGAAICVNWVLQWSDTNNNLVAQDLVSSLLDSDLSVQVPVKGTTLTISLNNIGSVGTISYTTANQIRVWGDYRVITDTQIVYHNTALPTVTGWNVTGMPSPIDQSRQWIASFNSGSQVASTQYLIPFPLWVGSVSGWYQQNTQPLSNNATIVDLSYATQGNIVPGTSYGFGILANLPSAIASATTPVNYYSPSTQLALLIKTGSTAGGQTNLYLTGRT